MELNQVTLPVRDMDRATTFYLALGFTQIVDTPHYARFVCPNGGSSFSLSLEQGEFSNGAVIYFEVPELERKVESLIHKGIVFDQLPTEQRYLWTEAILHDPSGNKIKLYRAGENRLNPPWRVDIRAGEDDDSGAGIDRQSVSRD
ncbi:VOC family protein [Shewanella corallii]|uniref:VOC family protein n=1 Tax=Shewanella corallii TaxID=560080 RepID=A0ABT0NC06_9GAMM|nr:VOC family protein [Shewanella corallii]MCL2915635.1 VOC family protein [Shewanella corallii]